MGVPEMAVGLGDEETAILMADPGSDGLEIDAGLDRVAYQIMAHAVMRECSKAGELARPFHGLCRLPDTACGPFPSWPNYALKHRPCSSNG